eukprot:TRINITY_DN49589_c0_g1_i1.p1 TRINITY_DN49589_c0_g1~~TRINITY_DN49589_c0_g1_i1.p1  ORF type:complete len:809 (-),score=108.75 TRINITY_DN49589_c0_g1_i1:15-2375(-)
MLFITCCRSLIHYRVAYLLLIIDYLFGVTIIFCLDRSEPLRISPFLLGIPLMMVNVLQFVDAPGVSLQAKRVSALIVPWRTLELAGIVIFVIQFEHGKKLEFLIPGQDTPIEMSMRELIFDHHGRWVVAGLVSCILYYSLWFLYARRVKPVAALHSAVASGDLDTLRSLLCNNDIVKLDVSRYGPDGRTPLHLASRRGQISCMKLLVQEKADLNARTRNNKRNTALHLAALNQTSDALRYLCSMTSQNPSLMNAQNADGDTPLHIAARNHNADAVFELLSHSSIDTSIKNHKMRTPEECIHTEKFSFDRNQEGATVDAFRRAEKRALQQTRKGASEADSTTAASSSGPLRVSWSGPVDRGGNRSRSGSEEVEMSRPSSSSQPSPPDPQNAESVDPETERGIPLQQITRAEEAQFNRLSRRGSIPIRPGAEDALVVTNCGLSSFMLTNGLLGSAPSRFLLGNVYDEPLVDEQDHTSKAKIDDFQELDWLGSGNFGRVLLVRHKETGDIFAMKTLDKNQFAKSRMINKAHSEQYILKTVRHPFMVQLHYAFQSQQHWVLVMDFCQNGDLQSLLQACGTPGLRLQDAARFGGEALLAVEYLHLRNIIFRDLKLDNVLVDAGYRVKLTDFGFAKNLQKSGVARTKCGSPGYVAPEILVQGGCEYTKAVDLYAFGVMSYMLLSGGSDVPIANKRYRLPPKQHKDLKRKLDIISKDGKSFWAQPENHAIELVRQVTDEVPYKRGDSTELKEHPFFKKCLEFETVDDLLHHPGPFEKPLKLSSLPEAKRNFLP